VSPCTWALAPGAQACQGQGEDQGGEGDEGGDGECGAGADAQGLCHPCSA